MSEIIHNMTTREIVAAIAADSPIARVRRVFAGHFDAISAAGQIATDERRRMELIASNEICLLFGVGLP